MILCTFKENILYYRKDFAYFSKHFVYFGKYILHISTTVPATDICNLSISLTKLPDVIQMVKNKPLLQNIPKSKVSKLPTNFFHCTKNEVFH